jgi:hypothetical protein
MTKPYETTTYPTARPTTSKSTQRSNPSTPEHEIHSAKQPMKSQPESQNQEPNHESHLGITIRGATRAAARNRFKITRVDLAGECCGC